MNDSIPAYSSLLTPDGNQAQVDSVLITDIDSALVMPPVTLSRSDSIAMGSATPLAPYVEIERPAWNNGMEPDAKINRPGSDSAFMLLIATLLVVMIYSLRHCKNMVSTFFHELTDTRQRANLFEERTTNENSLVALLAVQLSVCVGILLYCYLQAHYSSSQGYNFKILLSFMCLYAGYYIFRIGAYNLVGYTFTSQTRRRLWLKGFTASQSLLALALPLPALAAIFHPHIADTMVSIAIILYLVAELMFIIKGFRIFYNKFHSLLYFILYLCTLEIIPILTIHSIACATF